MEQGADLGNVLSVCSPREQTLVFLRYRADYSYQQIAEVLDINETTARVQIHRAVKRVRSLAA